MTFEVRPAATADVMDAMVYRVRRGQYAAATGIWAEWEAGQTAIESTPRLYPPADDAPPGYEVRNYLTRRYGSRIVYHVTATAVVVHAFISTRRRPGHWHSRLTP